MKHQASPVKRDALAAGLPLIQPPSLRRSGKFPAEATAAIERLRATPHDVMVVAAYGLLLPQEVLDIAPHGCINIHASLLPRWRGAAPIHRAIEAGDTQTGITLMQMDAGLDTGAIIAESRMAIHDDDTTGTLHDRLALAGAQRIVQALAALERDGTLPATPQPDAGATYAEKISKHEAALDWRRPAIDLARQVRAFDPFPGCVATLDQTTLKIWAARPVERAHDAPPGTLLEVAPEGIVVACGDGALRLTQLQKPGGKRLPTREFLSGSSLAAGQRFALTGPQ